jgi:hypothetical protein
MVTAIGQLICIRRIAKMRALHPSTNAVMWSTLSTYSKLNPGHGDETRTLRKPPIRVCFCNSVIWSALMRFTESGYAHRCSESISKSEQSRNHCKQDDIYHYYIAYAACHRHTGANDMVSQQTLVANSCFATNVLLSVWLHCSWSKRDLCTPLACSLNDREPWQGQMFP